MCPLPSPHQRRKIALASLFRGHRPRGVPPAPPSPSASWLVLALVLGFGVFFSGLDQTVVVTVLPQMMPDLGITIDTFGRTAWVVNSYLLGYTVALPLMGTLADRFGLRRLYAASTGCFLLGTMLVALSPNLGWFTIARALQALGGGALLPITFALVATTLPPAHRVLALGLIAALDDASSLLGPVYGAVLVDHIGWRGLFWLNVPLQLPWLLLTLAFIRPGARRAAAVDWPSMILLTLAITTAAWGLTERGSAPPPAARQHLALGLALALGISLVFWRRQRHLTTPLLRLDTAQPGRVALGIGLYGIDGAATITAMVCLPVMTDVLWGKSTVDGGLNLLKLMLWMPIGGILGGMLTPRLGFRPVAVGSFSLVAIGFFLMRFWPTPPPSSWLWGTLGLLGLGIGLNDAAILGHTLHATPTSQRATAASITQATQCIGMMTGMALLAWLGLGRFTHRASMLFAQKGLAASPTDYQQAMLSTFHDVFLTVSLLALAAALLALMLPNTTGDHLPWFAEAALAAEEDKTSPTDNHPSPPPPAR